LFWGKKPLTFMQNPREMSNAFDQVLTQVRGLSREEHFALMEVLLQLLREREKLVLSAAWEQELDRRDAALDAGEMELRTWEEVKARIVGGKKGV
jgi:putative addiction module component (TIGR02574 family)